MASRISGAVAFADPEVPGAGWVVLIQVPVVAKNRRIRFTMPAARANLKRVKNHHDVWRVFRFSPCARQQALAKTTHAHGHPPGTAQLCEYVSGCVTCPR